MGAWGSKAFDNDAALDWLAELEAQGTASLRDVLARVAKLEAPVYLDVDDASAAVAAAEVVAAMSGAPRDQLPERVVAWLAGQAHEVESNLVTLARRALRRVLDGNSELRDLWTQTGPEDPWQAEIKALLGRLGANAAAKKRTKSAKKRASSESNLQTKQALFTFLQMRGLVPTEAQREIISASDDPEELTRWMQRVVDAASVEALLAEA